LHKFTFGSSVNTWYGTVLLLFLLNFICCFYMPFSCAFIISSEAVVDIASLVACTCNGKTCCMRGHLLAYPRIESGQSPKRFWDKAQACCSND